ncbi:hypothetical protein DFH08DRAFT_1084190 [Mycena albidolilacea]|uniref:Uncharacterized protein n=1 Tax=Mycena albidolilacea TaxID=1033008 RepID=A0AAD7EJ91_9AGAR|nr:hypothetical protein DFH08DRAFT_1084190 [Mycena albidolilacea]
MPSLLFQSPNRRRAKPGRPPWTLRPPTPTGRPHSARCVMRDVLPHSGDLTRSGTLNDLRHMMAWLYALPHPIKIIIASNSDSILDREWYDVNRAQTGRHGNEATWERSPNVGGPARAFSYDKVDGEAMMGAFPSTNILLTHCPPHNILDLTNKADRAWCPALATRAYLSSSHACTSSGTFTRCEAHIFICGPRRWAQYVRQRADYESRLGPDELIIEEEREQTVFVNAANHPSGPNVPREYGQLRCGWSRVLTGKYTSIIWKCLLQATLYRVYIRQHVKFNLTPRWTLGRSREIQRTRVGTQDVEHDFAHACSSYRGIRSG